MKVDRFFHALRRGDSPASAASPGTDRSGDAAAGQGLGPDLPFVKICCITTAEEARLALGAGADALGFVSSMPSGPGVIPLERITDLMAGLPAKVATVLLTSWTDPAIIVEQTRRCGAQVVQLCEELRAGVYGKLRRDLPGIPLIQVIHVTGRESVNEARFASLQADALLLDSGRPDAAVPELGGTGRIHDWRLSRRIRDGVSCPVILAGGLNPDNLAQAFEAVNPHGVDVCSGVRSGNAMDSEKLRRFMAAAAKLRGSAA